MDNYSDEIILTSDDGEEVVFHVVEQTRLGGVDYLLVSTKSEDSDEEEALILKDVSEDTDIDAIYEIVEDEKEIDLVAKIFKELIDDIELY
ncbi:MAG TPA: DUF1292 domain-containing protein [Clostridiales bacterium]|nr:DUF1292 domain-containing protein [Clostridiales bacterium]